MFEKFAFAVLLTLPTPLSGCGHQQVASTETPVVAAAQPTSGEPKPAAAAPTAEPPPSAHMQSPMSARLEEPATIPKAGTIDIVLQVTRIQPTLAPITIKVELPSGVALATGQPTESVTDTTLTKFDRTFRFSYSAIPVGDAKIIVDWQTEAAGFHAELPYRFGRPAPTAKEPARAPGEVVLPGGQSLGRPILTNGGKKPDK